MILPKINIDMLKRFLGDWAIKSEEQVIEAAHKLHELGQVKDTARFHSMLAGIYDAQVFKRYGHYCHCAPGERVSYASTMQPGVAYAMLMQPNECVKCHAMHSQLRNACQGMFMKSITEHNARFGRHQSNHKDMENFLKRYRSEDDSMIVLECVESTSQEKTDDKKTLTELQKWQNAIRELYGQEEDNSSQEW